MLKLPTDITSTKRLLAERACLPLAKKSSRDKRAMHQPPDQQAHANGRGDFSDNPRERQQYKANQWQNNG